MKLAYANHVAAATLMALRMGFSLPFFLAMAMIGTIGPVVTMVLGPLFLGEPITVVQAVGATLVLGGVTWVTTKGKTRSAMATRRPSHASQA